MFKNVASQKLTVFAWDTVANVPKTGDAANITAYVSINDGTVTALTDTSATEQDATNARGVYIFDLSQAETNGDKLTFSAKSSTSGVYLDVSVIYTQPPNFTALSVDSNGRVDVGKMSGTTLTARDIGASVLLSSGTGTGQVSLSAGLVALSAAQSFSNTGTWTGNIAGTVSTVTNLTNAPTNGDFTSTMISTFVEQFGLGLAGVDENLIAIKAKTDNLPASPAATGDIPSAATVATQVNSTLSTAHGAGSWEGGSGGSGDGAYPITVTVTDGTNPLQNALVRVTDGITPLTAITDASGEAEFSLDAANYTVTATKAGYQFSPTSRTVTGSQSGTLTDDLEMTLVVIPSPPMDPAKGTVYGSIIMSDGGSKAGVPVTARLVGPGGPYKVGPVLIAKHQSTVTNASGQWGFELYGNADITPAGTEWQISIAAAKFDKPVTVVSGESTDADDLVE